MILAYPAPLDLMSSSSFCASIFICSRISLKVTDTRFILRVSSHKHIKSDYMWFCFTLSHNNASGLLKEIMLFIYII